ncbi:hypothetical protein TNCV_2788981 [Trichonephila clavipes]|uniref:Uncharacterized protein n=1 Tax=Trichonephila clavipes TaxID=2585209 RepID=A0A8X6VWG9_TRICX|nr:hypothetical protein TNCV_2788981 [Trichonephila clavipes]
MYLWSRYPNGHGHRLVVIDFESLEPYNTCRVEGLMSPVETQRPLFSRCGSSEWGLPVQASSSCLDHGSILRAFGAAIAGNSSGTRLLEVLLDFPFFPEPLQLSNTRAKGDGPSNFEPWSSDEPTPALASPSPNYHTTPTGRRLSSRQIYTTNPKWPMCE